MDESVSRADGESYLFSSSKSHIGRPVYIQTYAYIVYIITTSILHQGAN